MQKRTRRIKNSGLQGTHTRPSTILLASESSSTLSFDPPASPRNQSPQSPPLPYTRRNDYDEHGDFVGKMYLSNDIDSVASNSGNGTVGRGYQWDGRTKKGIVESATVSWRGGIRNHSFHFRSRVDFLCRDIHLFLSETCFVLSPFDLSPARSFLLQSTSRTFFYPNAVWVLPLPRDRYFLLFSSLCPMRRARRGQVRAT